MFRDLTSKVAAATYLLFAAATTQAASVSLVPSATDVGLGETFSLSLNLDATDAPGTHPGQFSGLVSLEYDPTYVSFDSFSFDAPASELQAVSQTMSGSNEVITLGFANATDIDVIGQYFFTVNDSPDPLPSPGTVFSFDIYDGDDFFDSFANELGTNQTFAPDFSGTTVSVVPLPAPLVFLASALATLVPALRRRATS